MPYHPTRFICIALTMMICTLAVQANDPIKKKYVIIDVRSDGEFNDDHVKGALHMGYRSIDKLIGKKVPDKKQKIYVYCAVGYRAGMPKKTLEKMGYTNVHNGGGLRSMRTTLAKLDETK
ncbi:hypothetical protein BVY04_05305 [bacterium M21]|nr:hypothetical protein BVY04_05305 [bacterium M21]